MFPRYITVKKPKRKKQRNISLKRASDFKCSSSESDNLEDIVEEKPSFEHYDYPIDYWKFQKCIKYLSAGKPVITTLSLIDAYECDFQDPVMLKALSDHKVIEVLLNILEWKDKRIQTISLRFLKKLSSIQVLRYKIVYLRGIESMVSLLENLQIDIKQLVAETITAVADFHKAWKAVRISGGIPLLTKMISVSKTLLLEANEKPNKQTLSIIKAAEAASEALFVVCKCRRNRIEFLLSGGLEASQKILQTSRSKLSATVMKLIHRCASEKIVRLAVKNLRLVEDFRVHFYSIDPNIMQSAAHAAYVCTEGEESEKFFGQSGFVDKLYEITQRSLHHSDEQFMIAISGALWKSAESKQNAARLQDLNAIPFLLQLLSSQTPKVQENIVACLNCCIQTPQTRAVLRKNNGIEILIDLLRTTHAPLIMHLNRSLAIASNDAECLALMEKLQALRHVWSHLKNEDPSVVSNTTWQLTTILKNIERSAVYIRSLVGGIQLLTNLLLSNETRILTPVCALIVVISKEKENLKILTDYQVVKRLSNLTDTKCRRLRYYLCRAISACCPHQNNRQEFANHKIVYPLIGMLKSKSQEVSGAATHALSELSWLPVWCAVMYNSKGVYKILIEQMKHKDPSVQQCAADIIQRMRLFALNRDNNIPDWLIEKHSDFFCKVK